MKKTIISVAVVVFGALVLACGQTPTSIEVTPPSVVLNAANATQALAAQVMDAKGEVIAQPVLAWTSADPAVAEVDATGTVTAKKSGKTTVSVQAGEVKKDVEVTVAIFGSVKIAETAVALKVGENKPVAAQILDEAGNPIEGKVEWKSSDENIAKVDANGAITAVNPGAATVTASIKEISAAVQVTVAPNVPPFAKLECGDKLAVKGEEVKKIEYKALAEDGKPVEGVVLTWVVAKPEIASITPAGEVKGLANGETEITGTVGDKTVKVMVKVSGIKAAPKAPEVKADAKADPKADEKAPKADAKAPKADAKAEKAKK